MQKCTGFGGLGGVRLPVHGNWTGFGVYGYLHRAGSGFPCTVPAPFKGVKNCKSLFPRTLGINVARQVFVDLGVGFQRFGSQISAFGFRVQISG